MDKPPVNEPIDEGKKSKWKLTDAFAMAVRPVRITASHAGNCLKHAYRSVNTTNPLKKEFWSTANYNKEEMILALDKYFAASSSALALGIVAGITVVGSPVLGGLAYAGLNTQMNDDESTFEVDKKFKEFMKSHEPDEASLQGKFMTFAGKPVNVAKKSYGEAMQDLREGHYLSATKGFAVSSVMGAALKGAGIAAMSSVGKAAIVYGGAAAATNAVYDRFFAKNALKKDEPAQEPKKIPYAVINPNGPDAHLLAHKPA